MVSSTPASRFFGGIVTLYDPEEPEIPATPQTSLKSAVDRILRALVRLLLEQQITFPTLSQWLKAIYVDVAEKEFPVDGKPQTDSRITLLTGVHRKEVRRLRKEGIMAGAVPAAVSLGAALVASWVGNRRYLDEDGKPLPLPRLARGSDGPSFEELVSNASKDIRPRVVLDEWLRLGICRLDREDRVWLNTAAFVPEQGFDEKAYYLGRNVHDHIAACIHNLNSPEETFIERSVYYDQLTEAQVRELSAYAREVGMEALLKVNQKALELQEAADGDCAACHRMNYGVYFFAEPEERANEGNDESGQ